MTDLLVTAGLDEEKARRLEEARDRLLARGLLREVAEHERAGTPNVLRRPDIVPVPDRGPAAADDLPFEEPHGPTSIVRCPSCQHTQAVAVATTGFRCGSCGLGWRWAACGHCDRFVLTVARQESWHCSGCGRYTRSWWRTSTATRDAAAVAARRRQEAEARAAEATAGARRARKLRVAVTAVTIAVVAAAAGALVAARASSAGEHTRAACASAERLRVGLAAGAVTRAALAGEVSAVVELAGRGDRAVASAARALAAAVPGTPGFAAAQTAMQEACTANRP